MVKKFIVDHKEAFLNMLFIVLCLALVKIATPYGLGVSPDSVMYLAAARSLKSGAGLVTLQWDGTFSFMGHFPPIFSALLVLIPEVIQRNAFWLQGILLFISGQLVYNITLLLIKDKKVSRAAELVTILSYPMLYVHTQVWSEPLMIAGLLLVAFLLLKYNEKKDVRTLYALTAVAIVLPLVRYAALFVIPFVWITVVLIWHEWSIKLVLSDLVGWRVNKKGSLKKYLTNFVKMLSLGLILVIPYISWQKYVALQQTAVRTISWHPITLPKIAQGITTIASWFSVFTFGNLAMAMICVAVVSVLVASLIIIFRNAGTSQKKLLGIVAGLIVMYLGFLVVSISLFDAATPLDNRILVPILPFITILLVVLLYGNYRYKVMQLSVRVVVALFVLTAGYRGGAFVAKSATDGQQYADKIWQTSETVLAVKRIPKNTFLFSNSREGIYSITGRAAATLPKVESSSNRKPALAAYMSKYLLSRRVCIVYFDRIFWNSSQLPTREDIKTLFLYNSVENFSDGAIYCN